MVERKNEISDCRMTDTRVLRKDKHGETITEGTRVEYQYPNTKCNETGTIEWNADECRYRLRVDEKRWVAFPPLQGTKMEVIFYSENSNS